MTDFTLDQTTVTAFTNNMRLRPQQLQSRLVPCVMADLSHAPKGDSFTAEFQGSSEPEPRNGRAPATPDKFFEEARRVGYFEAMHDSAWLDKADSLNKIADPTSGTMMGLLAGKERARDRLIYRVALAAANEGKNGQISVAFPAAQVIAVNDWKYYRGKAEGATAPTGNSPLTPAKLRTASALLDEAEIQGERVCVVCADDLANMLTSIEVTSSDFVGNQVQALVDGKIDTFMGFKFVRLPTTVFNVPTANVRDLIAFVQPAIEYKSTDIEDATIQKRADKSNTPQAYYAFRHGALRAFDNGVVNIKAAF
jgi:hypothetical protein